MFRSTESSDKYDFPNAAGHLIATFNYHARGGEYLLCMSAIRSGVLSTPVDEQREYKKPQYIHHARLFIG